MFQSFLEKSVTLAQCLQGIGLVHNDKAALKKVAATISAPLIFDVGANRGQYIGLALREMKGRDVTIHAFEPGTMAFAELQRGFGEKSHVVLNHFALGSESGEKQLFFDAPGSELSSLYPRNLKHHGIAFTQSEPVRVETLDTYCSSHDIRRIHLLKLDVEGHELQVLKGALPLFENRAIDVVSFEFGGCNVDSRTYVRDFLDFFTRYSMGLARVTARGRLHRIDRYTESLEQFRTTCFVALRY